MSQYWIGAYEKIRKLPLDFDIPNYLEIDIQRLIDATRTELVSLDCEESEIYGSVNMALMAKKITKEQADWIRDYYVYGGYTHELD